MSGYKGFEANMTCRGFQYEVGKTYEMDGEIEPCRRGFHFCRNMADVLNYYKAEGCRYAKVEALGKIIDGEGKSVTDRIRIVKELTKEEVFKEMASCAGVSPEPSPFPADEVIRARGHGTLDKLLPSGTEFPVQFSNGEWNVLVVCRDSDHTYLVTKHLMVKAFAMNVDYTNRGGWPACEMREHVNEIYDMLPEDIKKAVIPLHIKQVSRGKAVECDDMAFLLSAVNIFGEEMHSSEAGCNDSQIDIFQEPARRVKARVGSSSASWWWLQSAYGSNSFYFVGSGGFSGYSSAIYKGGVVVGFCIETRS